MSHHPRVFVTYKRREFHVRDGYLGLIDLGIKTISEITGLSEVQGVKTLNLGGNQIMEVRSSDFSGEMLVLEKLILECNPVHLLESLKHLTHLNYFLLREHDLPDGFDFKAMLPMNDLSGDWRKHPYIAGRVGTIAAIKDRWPFQDIDCFATSDIADDFTEPEAEMLETPFIVRFSIRDGGEGISIQCQKKHLQITESPTWDAEVRFETPADLIAYFNSVDDDPSEFLDDPSEFLENHEVAFLQNVVAARAGFKYVFWCIYLDSVDAHDGGLADGYQDIDASS